MPVVLALQSPAFTTTEKHCHSGTTNITDNCQIFIIDAKEAGRTWDTLTNGIMT